MSETDFEMQRLRVQMLSQLIESFLIKTYQLSNIEHNHMALKLFEKAEQLISEALEKEIELSKELEKLHDDIYLHLKLKELL